MAVHGNGSMVGERTAVGKARLQSHVEEFKI